jgi:hypothetical protein
MTPRQPPGGGVHDRATVTSRALFQVMADGVREWLNGAPLDRFAIERRIADRLRDDYAEIKREITDPDGGQS